MNGRTIGGIGVALAFLLAVYVGFAAGFDAESFKEYSSAASKAPKTGLSAKQRDAIVQMAHGKTLYLENCRSCHRIYRHCGTSILGALQRYDMEWLVPYTRNAMKMVEDGDPMAVALYREYKETKMSPMEHLSRADVEAIYLYLEAVRRR